MINLFIITLQNKVMNRDKITLFRRFQLNWWLNQGEEKKVIENLLCILDKQALPHDLLLAETEKLINYNVFQETQDYLMEALKYSHNSETLAQIYYLLARCFYGLGAVDEAISYLDLSVELKPNHSGCWNLKANCYLELGQWEDAVDSLNKSLRSSPGDAETIYRLGSIYLFHGEYGEALNCFCGCCKLNPFNPDYWEMKAEMLLHLEQIEGACECFRKAIRFNGELHLSNRLAYCYAKTGQLKKAKKLLSIVLKNQPDNYEALCNLASIYHKLDRDEQAYKLLKKAYTINCNDPFLLNNLGFICYQLGRSRKAIEYYQEAIKISPDDNIVLFNLGTCQSEKGLWEEAKNTLENLTSKDKNNSDAWAMLGNVYEQLSKYPLAVDCFNRSLGLVR
ncbi:MAG: TPR repeat-containing protein YrrB [Candidatus Dichloromethanomonas elyunquensis]|nr:MAG: TPR repeat-containing protein YrrB [Candidatus Dichloromethanomonas elyunquensis]